MPRSARIILLEDGSALYTEVNIRQRIKRRLQEQAIPKDFIYLPNITVAGTTFYKQFWVRNLVPDNDGNAHYVGPYLYKYWMALADMLEIWQPHERNLVKKIQLSDRRIREQEPMPAELRFPVNRQVLVDAQAALRAKDLEYALKLAHKYGFTLVPGTVQVPGTGPVHMPDTYPP
jgi:hypothetical protein